MKPITRYTLATLALLFASCGQEESTDTPAAGEQPAATQPETATPAEDSATPSADTPAPADPEPAPAPEPEPAPEPTPGPESADPEESDPEPTPGPDSADPEESDPEPTPGPDSADPEESDPEPTPGPDSADPEESDPEPTPGPESADPEECDPEPTPGPESADPEESDPEPTPAVGGDLAPADLTGCTVALNYESSQYKYEEDGEDLSGWQSFQNAKKNKRSCAEAFNAFGLKPKATRNLLPITTPARGGKYVYRKTGTNTGVISVNTGGADRTYTITFDSPTSGTAVEEVMGGSMMGYCRNIVVNISGGAAGTTAAPASAAPQSGASKPAAPAGTGLAPADLTGKTVALNYESSQYTYEEDGANMSGWQSFQNAKKNRNGCAEAFIALDLKPKATRNLQPISSPGRGGKYVYRKTGPSTGVLTVNTGGADRSYTITFTSPTTGTAIEEVMAGCMVGRCMNIKVTIK